MNSFLVHGIVRLFTALFALEQEPVVTHDPAALERNRRHRLEQNDAEYRCQRHAQAQQSLLHSSVLRHAASKTPTPLLVRAPPCGLQLPPLVKVRSVDRDESDARDWVEGIVSSVLRRHGQGQVVVVGDVPVWLPCARTFVVSPGSVENILVADIRHVRCEAGSDDWAIGLALQGFNWRLHTAWLLRMEDVSEPVLMKQLKAVATMSAACSVVVLLSWSRLAVQMAECAGFSMDVVQFRRPLLVLRRKERRATCAETESPYDSLPSSR